MEMLSKIKYAARVASVGVRYPAEFIDRSTAKRTIKKESNLPRPALTANGDWLDALRGLIGTTDDFSTDFERAWQSTARTLSSSGHVLGKGYDAGKALAEGAYFLTRALNPAVVVETGVARGITSRIILEAMERNGSGHLYSIDLPPLVGDWHAEAGAAVTPSLKKRWTYIRGSSRRKLPPLLAKLGPIPMFIHDSLHTYENMAWELRTAWPALTGSGVILCDDIEDNCAFSDFVAEVEAPSVIAKEPFRNGYIGAVRRPRSP